MKNGPATDHFGFCFEMGLAGLLPLGTDHFGFGFEMVLAGLLPLGMDHFGSGLEMVLARGRGVPLLASPWKEEISLGMKNGPGLDRFGFGLEAWSCQGCCLLV